MALDPFANLRAAIKRHGLSRLEQGGEVWDAIRRAGSSSLFFWNKFIWSKVPPQKNIMTWRTHGAICLAMENFSLKRVLIEYPRRTLKSTISTVSYPPFELHRMVMRDEDPWFRFFFMAFNMNLAKKQWEDVRLGFAQPKFQFFCPELSPPKNEFKRFDDDEPFPWNSERGEIMRQYRTKEKTFEAVAAKIVGPHFNIGLLDDMIDVEAYDSLAGIEKAVDMYRFAPSLLDDETDCRLIVTGNCWAANDLNATIHEEADRTGFTILSVSAETGANFDGERVCKNIPDAVREALEMIPSPAWPERFDEAALAKMRVELGPRIYSAIMLNNPEDPDATEFDAKLIKECRQETFEGESGVRFMDDNTFWPLRSLNLYVTWDPALDKNTKTVMSKKCENAVVLTFVTPDDRYGILREHARVENPLASLEAFVAFCREFVGYVKKAAVEEVLFQNVLRDLIIKKRKEVNLYVPLGTVKLPKTTGGKDARILAWLGNKIQSGKFYVGIACPKARKQIKTFGVKNAKKDVLDATALATKLWKTPKTEDEISHLENETRALDHARGVTGYGVIYG